MASTSLPRQTVTLPLPPRLPPHHRLRRHPRPLNCLQSIPLFITPQKGKYVVVKIKSNYAAYPSICYKNGFKPATVSRRTLHHALEAVKEACAERAWIRRYQPCRGCQYPISVAWDEKHNGRVELWERDGEKAYALCERTREQICKESGKCCEKKYKRGQSECTFSSSSSSSGSDEKRHDRRAKPAAQTTTTKQEKEVKKNEQGKIGKVSLKIKTGKKEKDCK